LSVWNKAGWKSICFMLFVF